MKKSIQFLAAATIAATSAMAAPALAERVLTGTEAHQMLAGQKFSFSCVDGTRGEASYTHAGVATASYRLPTAGDDATELKDQGRVRTTSEAICIRWNLLNSGTEGCYKMTERKPGQYRIAEGQIRWCDLTLQGAGDRAERN